MIKQRQKVKHNSGYKKYDGKDSGSDGEETEMITRNKPLKREILFEEKFLEDTDTLQSLAIRYHCTIEDLKRLNNIEKENEIYAKPTIKVPHRPISSLLAGVHISGTSSPEGYQPSTSSFDPFHLNDTLIGNKKQNNEVINEIIFNSNIVQKTNLSNNDFELLNEDSSEEVNLLPQTPIESPPEPIISKMKCSGVDGDISILALILCIVVVVGVVPLVYVFYIAEHPEQFHHNNT